jgi:predicted NAD/FAD-binding protein
MRVAIIGAGITGLGAAIALQGMAGIEPVLYEREPRAGGHAHSIGVEYGGKTVPVDTGFIVYNELNYPNLTALFDWAGVETIPSDMSFALSADDGAFEWCGRHEAPLGGLFAQKRNALDPAFYRFLIGIRRFQQRAIRDHQAGTIGEETLGAYLDLIGCNTRVRDDYVVPMGAAIWSMTPGETLAFPARAFMAFFNNHKLLQWDRPRWRTVKGGSRHYVERLAARLGSALRIGLRVTRVRRIEGGVAIRDSSGHEETFEAAIFATHAPTALALLDAPEDDERAVLGAFRVSRNRVVLHRDVALMPKRKAAWASWNLLRRSGSEAAAVTYWMNRLQALPEDRPLFVTLNPDREIAPETIFASFEYDHPVYDGSAIAAQAKLDPLQGHGGVFFAGAWTGFGFHEDGLRSGLAAASRLGGRAPWRR